MESSAAAQERASETEHGTILFKVNETLVKVPSLYLHQNSDIFASAAQIAAAPFRSMDTPIELPLPRGSSVEDFVLFAKIVWALVMNTPLPDDLTRGRWDPVLGLATFWEFAGIRELCVRKILETEPDSKTKVVLGRKHSVKALITAGLEDLADPDVDIPPPVELAEVLGAETSHPISVTFPKFTMVAPSPASSTQQTDGEDERHELFYIETVVFKVNNTLFKVPSRYLHEKSEVFECASRMSESDGKGVEGQSDERPVNLPLPDDAGTEDFVQLVKVIYPLTVNLPPPADLNRNQWTSVLKLSTFWELNEIRELAINEISKTNLTLIDKVVLGRNYRVRPWLLEGLNGLVDPMRDLPSMEELHDNLGTDTAMQLLYIRNFQLLQVLSCGTVQEDILLQHQPFGRAANNNNCWRCGRAMVLHPKRDFPSVESRFAGELAGFE
ncbi:hypothetical protein V5O48_002402 [Marasmius crinis-equi]|uniref:BTB domain-containing protein n=1 Tax=Marasmius crinis-equi TaxID=585013 RepID=A0ABR3FWB5_9AGAR